jgi:multiple antibiotic resistance protein
VFIVLAGAVLFGEALLTFMGASLPAFRVGGGLVLLLMSLAMLNAEVGSLRQSSAEARTLEEGEVSGVVPLAIPLLAGPGAISTAIIAVERGSLAHQAAIIVCIALVCLLSWVILRLAHNVTRRLGINGISIATRILGLLLAAMAVQTMSEGLKQLFPALGA